MKKKVLSLFALFICFFSVGSSYGQEFSYRINNYHGEYKLDISLTQNSVRVFDGNKRFNYTFSEYIISKDSGGAEILFLINKGLTGNRTFIDLSNDGINIFDVPRGSKPSFENLQYMFIKEDFVGKPYKFGDILAHLRNNKTFNFKSSASKIGNTGRNEKTNIVISLNLNHLYTGNLVFDIKSIYPARHNQTGENAVAGKITTKFMGDKNDSDFAIYKDKVIIWQVFSYGTVVTEYSGLSGFNFNALFAAVGGTSQTGTAKPGTSNVNWRSRISEVMSVGSTADSNGDRLKVGVYKSDPGKGFMIYQWADGAFYFGEVDTGEKIVEGVFVPAPGDTYQDIPDWAYFNGEFVGDKPLSGEAFDSSGNYLEWVIFHNGKVHKRVPGNKPTQKFQIIKYPDNDSKERDFYIGRTSQGKRHGTGMMVWKGNDIWIGNWSDDRQFGDGIYISSDGLYEIGKWNGGDVEQK